MKTDSKVCSKCGEEKLLTEFHAQRGGKYNKKSICAKCCRVNEKNRYAAAPVAKLEKVLKWQKNNPEKIREIKKRWAAKRTTTEQKSNTII